MLGCSQYNTDNQSFPNVDNNSNKKSDSNNNNNYCNEIAAYLKLYLKSLKQNKTDKTRVSMSRSDASAQEIQEHLAHHKAKRKQWKHLQQFLVNEVFMGQCLKSKKREEARSAD